MKKIDDPNDVIKPAVDGTMAVMRGAHKHGVKRVVITSSMAAVQSKSDKSQSHFTEDDWSEIEAASTYNKSKTLAERAAWDFVKGLPENEKFDVVTLLPGLVLGPCLI